MLRSLRDQLNALANDLGVPREVTELITREIGVKNFGTWSPIACEVAAHKSFHSFCGMSVVGVFMRTMIRAAARVLHTQQN